ncbi:flagellar hook-basal body complex protein [Sulfurospirillum arsenophilum]|uniref:flagellar hook-basal body complex protein n=1 Tax=Sulfurospirillum arsenophilum TaxID=56698 RepID=UPI0006936032|nr:flagellar hook-basal body complex protein [Sulfurospirillum arsenophilum]
MNSSFYNGVSGIKSQQFAMDVQANNIANANTNGYKYSSPEISSLFSTALTGAYASYANDRGLGAQSQTTALNMGQGVLENTDSPFDLAIQGEGWFGVKGQNAAKTYYTRAGSFSLDGKGSLVNADGYYLMATSGNNMTPASLDAATLAKFGTYYKSTSTSPVTPYAITPMTDIPLGTVGGQTKVTLPDILYYPPVATSKVSYGANLDPKITTGAVVVPLNAADYTATVTPSVLASLSGTISNTTALLNPQAGDAVTITLTDIDGKTQNISTTLDASLNWSILNTDISGLNTTSNVTASVSVSYPTVVAPLNAADYVSTVTPTPLGKASLSGTVSNTPALQNPKAGDQVTITLTDIDGKTQTILTTLDSSLNWSITNADVSSLNITSNFTASVSVTSPAATIPLNAADYTAAVTPTALGKVSLNGTVSNTTALQNPKEGDTVTITFTDINGKKQNISTTLDASLNWSITNADVSSLNTNSDLTTSVSVTSTQEVVNTEHYTTGIIAPDGTKDIIDMTFTKQVPQGSSGSTWNANVKVLSYLEDYVVENYDATKTYDPLVYNVDLTKGTVTKIYDPTKYYVDTSANKVYDIVDAQTGVLTFGGAGQLLSNSLPALSNGGTPLELNLGTVGGYDGLISSTTIKKSNVVTSNGTVEGFLTGYAMDGNGNIVAGFSNGKSSAIAKVAIYHFQNDQGLMQDSATLFEKSDNSGEPIFYTDKNGKSFLGSTIFSNKLEGSNINMATALTELIIVQKAFDASSKSITTSDELLQNAINMKR